MVLSHIHFVSISWKYIWSNIHAWAKKSLHVIIHFFPSKGTSLEELSQETWDSIFTSASMQVADLGLSKVKCQTLISGGVRGTLPWMAPELLNGGSILVSEKVLSFSLARSHSFNIHIDVSFTNFFLPTTHIIISG